MRLSLLLPLLSAILALTTSLALGASVPHLDRRAIGSLEGGSQLPKRQEGAALSRRNSDSDSGGVSPLSSPQGFPSYQGSPERDSSRSKSPSPPKNFGEISLATPSPVRNLAGSPSRSALSFTPVGSPISSPTRSPVSSGGLSRGDYTHTRFVEYKKKSGVQKLWKKVKGCCQKKKKVIVV